MSSVETKTKILNFRPDLVRLISSEETKNELLEVKSIDSRRRTLKERIIEGCMGNTF